MTPVDDNGNAVDEWEPCSHDCDDDCYDEWGDWRCGHQHCFACGGCGCPGYCDDHQTYNLRPPSETGGPVDDDEGQDDTLDAYRDHD